MGKMKPIDYEHIKPIEYKNPVTKETYHPSERQMFEKKARLAELERVRKRLFG